jgi:hypothetical protein
MEWLVVKKRRKQCGTRWVGRRGAGEVDNNGGFGGVFFFASMIKGYCKRSPEDKGSTFSYFAWVVIIILVVSLTVDMARTWRVCTEDSGESRVKYVCFRWRLGTGYDVVNDLGNGMNVRGCLKRV